MTDIEQTDHFAKELERLINRFRLEYEISYAAIIGTMNIKSMELVIDAQDDEEPI